MPVLQSRNYGDLYVEAEVETPINLSNKQRIILADFNDSISESNSPKVSKFKKFLKYY